MCGRYTLIRLADFTDMFPWIRAPQQQPPPRYNIAPTQSVAAVINDGANQISFLHWGLIPSWAKDMTIGGRMINARAETLAEKPAFRAALRRRRCAIPANGFFEWKRAPDGGAKTPMYIQLREANAFAFAGLWETWHAPDGSELRSCTIITVPPNELMAEIHSRMPAILEPADVPRWLVAGEQPADAVAPLLRSFPADRMQVRPVSRAVNSPKIDSPACIAPAADPAPPQGSRRRADRSDSGPTLFDP